MWGVVVLWCFLTLASADATLILYPSSYISECLDTAQLFCTFLFLTVELFSIRVSDVVEHLSTNPCAYTSPALLILPRYLGQHQLRALKRVIVYITNGHTNGQNFCFEDGN